jgi:hypothetical protein
MRVQSNNNPEFESLIPAADTGTMSKLWKKEINESRIIL